MMRGPMSMPVADVEPARGRRVDASLRTQRFVLGSAALTGARALTMALGVGLTAVVARLLSPAEFGLWALLTTLPAFAAHLDLGVGNALRNRLAALTAGGDTEAAARKAFVSCFWVFAGAGGLAAGLVFLAGPRLPWAVLFPHEPAALLGLAAASSMMAAAMLAFTVACGLGGFGFYAYQETHWAAGLEVLRQVLIVALTAVALLLNLGFLAVASAYFCGLLLASAAGLMLFVGRRGWNLRLPALQDFADSIRSLGRPSVQFTLLQLSSAVVAYTDVMIVTRVAGLAPAGEYALVQKVFFLLMIAQSFILIPLWSAYTHAEAQGDRPWVRAALRRSTAFTLLVNGAGALVLAVAGRYLVYAWTGKWIESAPLFASMAVWAAVYGWASCYSVFLNAVGRLRRQTLLAVCGAAVNIPAALYLGAHYGAVGVCWAGILSMLPLAVSNPLEARAFLHESQHPDPDL